jgi:hypothetical protein
MPDWNAKPPPKSIPARGWRRGVNSRLIASVMYPALASEADRQEMAERTEPGKRTPMQARANQRKGAK